MRGRHGERRTTPGNPSGEELLKFPTDYPIKVVGRPSAEFRARIHADRAAARSRSSSPTVSRERLSENGNFLSISYTIVAESREQVVALANDLRRPKAS